MFLIIHEIVLPLSITGWEVSILGLLSISSELLLLNESTLPVGFVIGLLLNKLEKFPVLLTPNVHLEGPAPPNSAFYKSVPQFIPKTHSSSAFTYDFIEVEEIGPKPTDFAKEAPSKVYLLNAFPALSLK